MGILGFDHVAIPTRQPEAMLDFYRRLGFDVPDTASWRRSGRPFFSIQLGEHKINVHAPGLWEQPGFTLRGPTATPGCGDFCFVWEGSTDQLEVRLAAAGAELVEGPVERAGGRGGGRARGTSYYVRDPDGNLLEFIVYPEIPG